MFPNASVIHRKRDLKCEHSHEGKGIEAPEDSEWDGRGLDELLRHFFELEDPEEVQNAAQRTPKSDNFLGRHTRMSSTSMLTSDR